MHLASAAVQCIISRAGQAPVCWARLSSNVRLHERATMYAPVGKCIYCGSTQEPLTREHIIPLSLGGSLVLPRATCHTHANTTSTFERSIARVMYGVQRADTGGVSRRPKELRMG